MDNKKTILIVDDSSLIIERTVGILSELETVGSIAKAGSYTEAFIALQLQQFDVAFLDIQLPGMNGIDLLRHIKSNYPNIVVVMLTNQATQYYRDLCKQEGAFSFIDKSKEFELIPQVVSSLS